jgi:hypothetical protein
MNAAKLDTILALMNEQEGHNPIPPKALANYLSIIEFREYSSQLIGDGYAEMVTKEADSSMLCITRKGIQFIRAGGYTIQEEQKRKSSRKKRVLLFVSLVSAGIVLTLLFIKLYFIFQKA